MAGEIELQIVTPEGAKINERVADFQAPSVMGEIGVLPGHLPTLAALQAGIVRWRKPGSGESRCAIGLGFIELSNDRAVILTDRYKLRDEVDPVLVRAELQEVDDKIRAFTGNRESFEFHKLIEDEIWCAVQLQLRGEPHPPTMLFANPFGPPPDAYEAEEGVTDGKPLAVE